MIYTVSVENKTIKIIGDNVLIRGNVEIDYLEATFDSEWDDMERIYCVFYDNTPEGTRMKLEDGRCEIPWERLEKTDDVKLTFIGYDDDDEDLDRRIVTRAMTTDFDVKDHGFMDGDDPAEPTPTAWTQLEDRVEVLEKSGGPVPDVTLSEEGRPADAKAVGDALAEKQPKGDYLTEVPEEYALKADVEGIVIGGRNLLVYGTANTSSNHEGFSANAATGVISGTGKYYIMFDAKLEPGAEYTVSVESVESNGDYGNACSVKLHDTVANVAFKDVGRLSGGDTITFTAPENTDEAKAFLVYPTSGTLATYAISNLKLEKGNKATDWTPAPEDVDAKLAEYVTESELEAKGYLTEHQSLDEYALKTELPTVPTNVSAFENDKGYLTEVPENVVTWDELLVTLDQIGIARPVASEAGELFTDEDGKIYVI